MRLKDNRLIIERNGQDLLPKNPFIFPRQNCVTPPASDLPSSSLQNSPFSNPKPKPLSANPIECKSQRRTHRSHHQEPVNGFTNSTPEPSPPPPPQGRPPILLLHCLQSPLPPPLQNDAVFS